MKTLRAWLLRFAGLIHRQNERELTDEFASHFEMQIEANERAGMNGEEARRAAALKLGNVESAKESYRERATVPGLENFLQDSRYALRQLRRNPVFALTAVATLALGMCASIAIFAFVNAALVKPLPYADSQRLLGVFESVPGFRDTANLSYQDFLDWRRLNTTLAALDIYKTSMFLLKTREGTEVVPAAAVSAGFFRTLGVTPLLGRDLQPQDDIPNAAPVTLLSYSAWQKRFGGSRDAIGKTIVDAGTLRTIIGVLPRGFAFAPAGNAEFWKNLYPLSECDSQRSCHDLYGVGRLKPGESLQNALTDLKSVAKRLERQYPENRDQGANSMALSAFIVGPIRNILLLLMCGAMLLLVIAVVNVANLLLVRGESRRREMAVRRALGAGRLRLLAQHGAETVLLVLAGTVLGISGAFWLIRLLQILLGADTLAQMPYFSDLHLDRNVLLFAGLLAVLALLLFTLVPSLRTMRDVRGALSEGSRGSSGTGWRRTGSRLVILELATATILLAGAGLLGKSLFQLMRVDIGLDPDRLITLKLGAPKKRYAKEPQLLALEQEMLASLGHVPGVASAAFLSDLPVENWGDTTWFRIIGHPWHGEHNDTPERDVSAGYFQMARASLLHGRFFREDEDSSKPLVAIVNQAFAKHYFPGEDPVGKEIAGLDPKAKHIEIVGLVADIKEGPLDTASHPVLYFPFNQNLSPYFNVMVRTRVNERSLMPSITAAIHQINPEIAVTEVKTMREKMSESQAVWLHRSSAWLVAGFAGVALLLGVVGLYGVVAYSVAQRTREIGVRMALGAERGGVYRLVLGEAGQLAAIGLLAGVLSSIALSRWMSSLLFEVHGWDLAILSVVTAVLGAAAMGASFVPARRAAAIDPMNALRSE